MASILNVTLELLGLTNNLKKYNLLSQLMSNVPLLVFSPLAAHLLNRCGVRKCLYISVVLISIRSGARILLFVPSLTQNWISFRFVYWIVAQLAACAIIAIYYSLPLKISENWFSASERTFAWSAIAIAPQVGSGITSLILPRVIKSTIDLPKLAVANLVALIVSALLTLACIKRSKPLHPPSARFGPSARTSKLSLGKSALSILTRPQLLLFIFFSTVLESGYEAIGALLADILSAANFDAIFAGQMLAILGFSNAFAQLFLSATIKDIPDGEKQQSTYMYKIIAFMTIASFISYTYALSVEHQTFWWIIPAVCLVSILVKQVAVVNLKNLSTYLISGIVSEPVFGSALAISNIILCNVSLLILTELRTFDQTSHKPHYKQALTTLSIVLTCLSLLFIAFFNANRKDSQTDQENLVENEEQIRQD